MKRIPIAVAKRVAHECGLSQIILVGWNEDTKSMHVVTYGRTLKDCEQAAKGGNFVKKALGYPPEMCEAKPSRVLAKERKLGLRKSE